MCSKKSQVIIAECRVAQAKSIVDRVGLHTHAVFKNRSDKSKNVFKCRLFDNPDRKHRKVGSACGTAAESAPGDDAMGTDGDGCGCADGSESGSAPGKEFEKAPAGMQIVLQGTRYWVEGITSTCRWGGEQPDQNEEDGRRAQRCTRCVSSNQGVESELSQMFALTQHDGHIFAVVAYHIHTGERWQALGFD